MLASPRWAFHLHFFQKHPAQSVLYCESIPQGRHSSFLSNLADKTSISHSYQNKGESSQSDRGYLSSAGIHYSLHCPSQTTSTTVSPQLGYQMCMAQFGMRDTQINILPQGCMGETSCQVSKWNILGSYLHSCCLMAAVMLWCSLALNSSPVSVPDLSYHGEDCQSAKELS